MRILERIPDELEKPLRRSAQRDAKLVDWLVQETEDAFSARHAQEEAWQEHLRMYNGVPRTPFRSVPIENAPNIEIPLGAIAVDTIYAQAIELLFSISPVLTTRAMRPEFVDHAKALQKFVNWGVANEWMLRPAAEQVILDDTQLGTGVYYVPWTEMVKKTDIARIKDIGPRILAVPAEDFLTPGGAYADLQTMPWIAMRSWMTANDLADRKRERKWKTDGMATSASLGVMRSRRESLGRTNSSAKVAKLYEVLDVYCRFDYDNDGLAEDLLVIWDRTSRAIAWLGYAPYDARPFSGMRYQLQPYLWHGLGILEMMRPFQEEVTEAHNDRALNVKLANTRMWKARTGSIPDGQMVVYPNKLVELNDPNDLQELRLSEIYPSAVVNEQASITLAQKRVGMNDITQSTPLSSSRTPGVTAVSFLQQQNRRFVPAFDAMRLATSEAVVHCLYRYRERLLAGDLGAERNITRVLGQADADLVIRILREEGFEEAVSVELTASSASINKDADRQNALYLINVLGQYYQQVLQLVSIAANPQTPPEVRAVAQKIAAAGTEIVDRTIRTFDVIRDPETFLVQIQPELEQIDANMAGHTGVLNQLMQSIAGAVQGGQGEQGNGLAQEPMAMQPVENMLPNSGQGSV